MAAPILRPMLYSCVLSPSQIFLGLPGSALESIMLIAPAHRLAGSQPSDTAATFYVYAGRWQGRRSGLTAGDGIRLAVPLVLPPEQICTESSDGAVSLMNFEY